MATTYQVIARGFYKGLLHSPDGPRNTLTVDKPFKKNEMPSWVKDMKATRKKSTPADLTPKKDMTFLDGESTVEKL